MPCAACRDILWLPRAIWRAGGLPWSKPCGSCLPILPARSTEDEDAGQRLPLPDHGAVGAEIATRVFGTVRRGDYDALDVICARARACPAAGPDGCAGGCQDEALVAACPAVHVVSGRSGALADPVCRVSLGVTRSGDEQLFRISCIHERHTMTCWATRYSPNGLLWALASFSTTLVAE